MKATHDIIVETRAALPALVASKERKNEALLRIADRLVSEQDSILEANRADVEASRDRYGDSGAGFLYAFQDIRRAADAGPAFHWNRYLNLWVRAYCAA